MFGKPKNEEVTASNTAVPIQVTAIPTEFYGGRNPIVKFRIVEKEVNLSKMGVGEQKSPFSKTNTTIKIPLSATGLTNRHSILMWSGVLFVIFLAGASGYYWWQAKNLVSPSSPVVPVAVVSPPVVPEATTPNPVTPDINPVVPSTTIPVASSTISLGGGNLEFPSVLLGDSADQDHDGLNDVEEAILATNVNSPDTDNDQYSDSTEIFNLYSPTVAAPARLIDTDVVQDYSNATFGYRLYFPTSWVVGSVDSTNRDVIFSSINGESIELRVFDKTPGQTFENWFAIWAQNEHTSSLRDFSSVFKVVGRSRSDNLVSYFTDGNHVYVLLYHPIPNSNVVNFREIISMMARSFRLATTPTILPEQLIVPPIPTVDEGVGANL
jgi:hypothetical protein